jgi:hypothetical protein
MADHHQTPNEGITAYLQDILAQLASTCIVTLCLCSFQKSLPEIETSPLRTAFPCYTLPSISIMQRYCERICAAPRLCPWGLDGDLMKLAVGLA